jgi:hypothetical protein
MTDATITPFPGAKDRTNAERQRRYRERRRNAGGVRATHNGGRPKREAPCANAKMT